MKVALVNKDFDASLGGGELYATNLARGLRDRGYQVTLIARTQTLEGFDFRPVEVPPAPRHLRVRAFSDAARAVLDDREAFDVVHAMTQFYPADVHRNGGGIFRHWETITQPNPLIRGLVALGRRNRVQRELENQIYSCANVRFVQTNSRMVKGEVERYYGVPADRVVAIHNGVDLERFEPVAAREAGARLRAELSIPAEAPVVLFVGNNIRRKGLARLARGLGAIAGGEGVHLVVVGDAPEAKVRKACRPHRGPLHAVGGQRDVLPYYGAADVFVIPTHYDPFANVTLEALACGVPTVSSTGNGAHEVLEDPAGGRVVADADDPLALGGAIDELLAARGEAGRAAARQLALGYPWSRNLDAVERLYKRVEADKAAPRASWRRP